MQYEVAYYENEAFIIKLQSKLEKEAEMEEKKQSIEHVMSDIRNFLLGNEEEMLTN